MGTKLNKARLIFSVAVIFFFYPVYAREIFSFSQCVDLVKQNNLDILAAKETVRSKSLFVYSARGEYFPQITGNLGYLQSGPVQFVGTSVGHVYSANLTATQNIFNGFADESKINQAQALTRSAQASMQIALAKASYELKLAFANLLFAKESQKVTSEFQKRREENLRMVELRFESGRENKGSLLLSQAYLRQSKLDVLKAIHGLENSQSDLKKVLGIGGDVEFDVKGDIPLNDPSAVRPDFDGLVRQTPTRSQAMSEVESNEAAVSIAKSRYFPTLNLTGVLGKSADHFFPDRDKWSVGATFSWPLFGGGKDYYSTQSVVHTLAASKSNLYNLNLQLVANLKKSYNVYSEAVEDQKVNEAFYLAAKSRAEIARAKYNNGLLTFDEWDIIENDLINKTKIFIQSKRDRVLAEAAWEQTQGIGVISE